MPESGMRFLPSTPVSPGLVKPHFDCLVRKSGKKRSCESPNEKELTSSK
jgi:hypothetical protein